VRTAEATVHATVTTASKEPPLGFTCTCPDLNDLPAGQRSVDPLCPHHGGRCAVAPIPQQPVIDCKLCDEHGGSEGGLHRPATVRVILLRRPEYDGGQATDAEVSLLCLPHAVRFVGDNLEVADGPHTLLIEHLTPTL
jgi:hypothetical protein